MEKIVRNCEANSKDCLGCQRHKKDIMITFRAEEKEMEFYDFFLTDKQAKGLIKSLEKSISQNH